MQNTSIKKAVGQAIKKAREAHDISLMQASTSLGKMSTAHFAMIEKGERNISLHDLFIFCINCGISVQEALPYESIIKHLMYGEDKKEKKKKASQYPPKDRTNLFFNATLKINITFLYIF